METLAFFLAGAICGAAAMWSSNTRAMKAAAKERALSERREIRLLEERDACQAACESWRMQTAEMRIDQANNAGYLDGYNACRRELEAAQSADAVSDTISQALRDGKRVSWSVIGH